MAGQLTSEAILDPIRHPGETDCICQSQLMSSLDCLIRLPVWASHLEALVGEKKLPLFQRAQCYKMDTCLLLFISKCHTRTHPPASLFLHQHPGALAHSCNNPSFHGALLYIYSSYAPSDTPKPGARGTFSTPEGSCPTSLHPAAGLDPPAHCQKPLCQGQPRASCSQGRARQWEES